jgi:hypothetical protein
MIALFLLLVIVAMVLGIVGVVAKGLLYLADHRHCRVPRRPCPGRPADAAAPRQALGTLIPHQISDTALVRSSAARAVRSQPPLFPPSESSASVEAFMWQAPSRWSLTAAGQAGIGGGHGTRM